MAKQSAYACDRCGKLQSTMSYIDIFHVGLKKERKYLCHECMEEFYLRMQPLGD